MGRDSSAQARLEITWPLPAGWLCLVCGSNNRLGTEKMNINLEFLSEGKEYTMELIKDGINANETAVDYKKEIMRNVRKRR